MTHSSQTDLTLVYGGTQEAGVSEAFHQQTDTQSASIWRSLGGRLNYEFWAERERFLELDRAISARAKWECGDAEFNELTESADEEWPNDLGTVFATEDLGAGSPFLSVSGLTLLH
jgi:hypothetical protein